MIQSDKKYIISQSDATKWVYHQGQNIENIDILDIKNFAKNRENKLTKNKTIIFTNEYKGKHWGSMLDFVVLFFALKKDIVEKMKEEKISGFTTFPIAIQTKEGSLQEDYVGIQVESEVEMDYSHAVKTTKETIDGVDIIDNALDSESLVLGYIKGVDCLLKNDISILKDTSIVVISQKLFNLFMDIRVDNMKFEPLNIYSLLMIDENKEIFETLPTDENFIHKIDKDNFV